MKKMDIPTQATVQIKLEGVCVCTRMCVMVCFRPLRFSCFKRAASYNTCQCIQNRLRAGHARLDHCTQRNMEDLGLGHARLDHCTCGNMEELEV